MSRQCKLQPSVKWSYPQEFIQARQIPVQTFFAGCWGTRHRQGSFFHLTQNTWGKEQELGLVRQYSDDAATRHFCGMTERILRMRLERMSLAAHPFIMLGFSFHKVLLHMIHGLYPTFIDLCACLHIWQLNNRSNFNVWCNLTGLLT